MILASICNDRQNWVQSADARPPLIIAADVIDLAKSPLAAQLARSNTVCRRLEETHRLSTNPRQEIVRESGGSFLQIHRPPP